MELENMVSEWETDMLRAREEAQRAEDARRIAEESRTRERFQAMLGEYGMVMNQAGITWDFDTGTVTLKANGRSMVLTPAKIGMWMKWGDVSFRMRTRDDICEFFATVLHTLRIRGVGSDR